MESLYQEVIYKKEYARWDWDKKHRESWHDIVTRYLDFFQSFLKEHNNYTLDKNLYEDVYSAIYNLDVMPSMRAMWCAGKALKKNHIAGYNCTYIAIDHIRAFDEILYCLISGCGVGFSVERQEINKLPEVPDKLYSTDTLIKVADSKLGWAKSFKQLLSLLYAGEIPQWDVSKVRPAGTPLKTFGGQAAGADPLVELFNFTINVFKNATGRKLNSLECHDIACKIGEIVVSGGNRRSALISLSNLSDDRMRNAKNGQWWVGNNQRRLSNNSAAYTERPEIEIFMKEWLALVESKSGERGIFNRTAAQKQCEIVGREPGYNFGVNPCGEIILRSKQACNLTTVIIKPEDDLESLRKKCEIATILGTWQACLTDFTYLSRQWKENCQEERLLGVSLTGIEDNTLTNTNDETLQSCLIDLKGHCRKINKMWASTLGIPESAAITTIKPSGNVSQLTDTASGIHPRWSEYYVRNIILSKTNPLCKFMIEKGFPGENDHHKPDISYVFSFPIKSPDHSKRREDRTAIEQLDLWLTYKRNWCEHTASCSVYVREDEWLEVGSWVYKHFDDVIGLSFFPYDNGIYTQAPYTECSKEDYEELLSKMPKEIDWNELNRFEDTDNTEGAQTLACVGNSCEIR